MEAILHYRTKGHIDTQNTNDEIFNLLSKQTSQNLLDVRPYEYKLDNQCDYDYAHPSPEPHVNFYVIIDIDHKATDVTTTLKGVRNSNAVITQEWECGNEQYYVIQIKSAA